MKGRINKDLVVFIILIPIFIFFTLFLSNRMEDTNPPYTIGNKSLKGYSVMFAALKDLGYPVERSLQEVYSHDYNSIQLIADANYSFNYSDEVMEWIGKGGVLVHLTPNGLPAKSSIGVIKGSLNINLIGRGSIITVDGRYFTNDALIKDREIPYELLKELESFNYDRIYFNENHIYFPGEDKNLWDAAPIGIKLILYQLLLLVGAFFYYKGKTFGRFLPLYDEVERNENEYLHSVASLYQQGKCWDIMLESYYKALLSEMNTAEGEFLNYWRPNSKELNKAKKVHDFINSWKANKNLKEREYINIINQIDELRGKIRKGRDEYWKVLK